MRAWLLLVSGGVGFARGVVDISVSDGMPELEADRLQVGRVTVNGARSGDLASSAQQGSKVALRLLFRELGRNRSLAHLEVATEAAGATVTGRSSELLFGLAVFLHLARRDRLAVFPPARFAATGTLDPLGNVGSVDDVATKVNAALASELPAGGFLFYPRADDDQVSAELHRQCQAGGVHLRPIDRIDDALIELGIPMHGGWPGSPFRSLEPFNHEHARIFFGRQAEVTALVTRLDQRAAAGRPGALVIGASGAGKSSFCMAGLLPVLARETPALEHAIWRPRDAIAGKSDTDIGEADIARSLLAGWRRRDENQTGFAFAATRPDSRDLVTLAASLPEDALAHHRHVWVVDQFEELFTLGFSAEARIAFTNFLRDLQARGVWIIGTLRSEFYGQYLDLRDGDGNALLTQVFGSDGVFDLPRMGRDALHQVIIRPAELAGLRFETRASDDVRLDDVLLADALATDDALPLLGFTLQQLYDALERGDLGAGPAAEQPRTLTFAAYEALGGLKGAIGKIVEPRFALLDADARGALPGLLSALAVPSGDGLRETARPASIAQWPAGSPGRRLVDALIGIRVLVSEQAPTPGSPPQIRVAHEALFSHWDEARRILQESQQTRLQIEDFRQRADAWDNDGQPKGALLTSKQDIANARAVQLSVAVHAGTLHDFLGESLARHRRSSYSLISIIVLAILILAGLAWFSRSERNQSLSQRGRTIAQIAEQAIDRGDAMKGILLALTQANGRRDDLSADLETVLLHGLTTNIETSVLVGHTKAVLSASFSPNGQRIVTTSQDGFARVWTRIGNHWISVILAGHTGRVNAASFSPDGLRIVTASIDKTARVWTLNGQRWTSIALVGHTGPVVTASFSPDGHRIATASADRTVRLWTLESEHWTSFILTKNQLNEPTNSVRFSPDGRRIFTGSMFSPARLWMLKGDRWMSLALTDAPDAAFSPDGRRIVTTSWTNTARVWTLEGNRWTSVALTGHTMRVTSAAFSPDGRRIITASDDDTARLWTSKDDRWTSLELTGHADSLRSATFSPDGQYILTASDDKTARVWRVLGNRFASVPLVGHTGLIWSASFSPDGSRVVTASDDKTARVWTLVPNRWTPAGLVGHTDSVNSAAFSPDGRRIVTASRDHTTRVWTLAGNGWTSIVLAGHTGTIANAAFSRDGRRVVAASDDKTVRVWTLEGKRWISFVLAGHSGAINSAAFNPDGSRIVTASNDRTVRVWTFEGNRWVSVALAGHKGWVRSAAFSSDGRRVITDDGNLRVWTHEGNHWTAIVLGSGGINSAAFSPDGRRIVTALSDTAEVWTIDGSRWTSVILTGHTDSVNSAAFSPDGRRIVTASSDNTARVWTLEGKRWVPFVLAGHSEPVKSAAFSPDGRRIVTTSYDNTVRMWTREGSRWISMLLSRDGGEINSVAFSPDGRRIVAASNDKVAWVWFVPYGAELISLAHAAITRCLSNDELSDAGLEPAKEDDSSQVRVPPCR